MVPPPLDDSAKRWPQTGETLSRGLIIDAPPMITVTLLMAIGSFAVSFLVLRKKLIVRLLTTSRSSLRTPDLPAPALALH